MITSLKEMLELPNFGHMIRFTIWFPFTDLQDDIKNNFIIDYTDYTDLQDYIKNNFIIDYADYTDL